MYTAQFLFHHILSNALHGDRSFAVPTRGYAYAPSEAPVRFSRNWRCMFKKKPTTIWSIPGSEADCPYDIDDQAFGEQSHERTDGGHDDHIEQAEQDGIPMETHSVTQYDAGSTYDMPTAPEDSLEKFLATVRTYIQRFTEQFELQNSYNVAIEQNMQTVARDYARLRALEETVNAMQEELSSLSRATNDRAAQERVEQQA